MALNDFAEDCTWEHARKRLRRIAKCRKVFQYRPCGGGRENRPPSSRWRESREKQLVNDWLSNLRNVLQDGPSYFLVCLHRRKLLKNRQMWDVKHKQDKHHSESPEVVVENAAVKTNLIKITTDCRLVQPNCNFQPFVVQLILSLFKRWTRIYGWFICYAFAPFQFYYKCFIEIYFTYEDLVFFWGNTDSGAA